jgi:hypothetical protein
VRGAGLALALFCLLAAACDFPQGFGEGKGRLSVVLPGARTEGPAQNLAARAVRLPEPVTGGMDYTLDFYKLGKNFSVGPTREKVVTVELEPGYWDIAVSAWYGSAIAALDKKPQVEIRTGRENSVSFTMNADDFITPDISAWVNQDKNLSISDSPASLAITITGTTAFSGINGWTDNFAYRRYYEDADGNRADIDGTPVSFSGPGTRSLSYTVNPAGLGAGTFYYYAEISNAYSYAPPEGGSSTSGTAKKSIYVARVVVAGGTSYSVGDTGPGGGIIFYVNSGGFTSNGVTCRYLEAAPVNLSGAQWGADGTLTGANGTAIGTGYSNTRTIIAALSSGIPESGRAAQLCDAYSNNGYADWFLPSQDELRALADSFLSLGISTIGGSVWSSTEIDAATAWCDGHAAGGGGPPWADPKTNPLEYRPIRAF